MKLKVVLFGLILIAIIICLPNHNQAYVGPPYFDELGYPSEHPWQHDNSYEPEDSLNYSAPHIGILPIDFSIKAIQLIRRANCTKRSIDRPGRFESRGVQKLHFRKKDDRTFERY